MVDQNNMLPEGFTRVNPTRTGYYWQPKKGLSVRGILLGRFARKDRNERGEQQFYYHVELTHAADNCIPADKEDQEKATDEDGEEYIKPVTAKPGEIVQIDERYSMTGLVAACEAMSNTGQHFEVFVGVKGKTKLDGGRSVWDFDVGTRPTKQKPKGPKQEADFPGPNAS